MAKKKKPKATTASSPKKKRSNISSSSSSSSLSNSNQFTAIIAASLLIAICCIGYLGFKKSLPGSALLPTNAPKRIATKSTGELFIDWFIDNGGIFHPIGKSSDGSSGANDEGMLLPKITIQKFDGMGWGLAAIVNNTSSSTLVHTNDNVCEMTDNNANHESSSCSSPTTPPLIIIPHLAPLFTVPSHLIISISSILQQYSSPSSPHYLPNFYPIVNQVLLSSFPRSVGLAKMSQSQHHPNNNNNNNNAAVRMGLVEQDVVIAMMLMTEQCLHPTPLNHTSGSFWGPYLDMLAYRPIPRLDTFDREEYQMLKDDTLERMGRSSKERLIRMFYGKNSSSNKNNNHRDDDDDDDDVSIKAVLREMIHIRQQPSSIEKVPPTCLEFDTFHKFIGIVSSRAMVLKGIKYLTPLAEMINYAPVSPVDQIVVHSSSSSSSRSDESFDGQEVVDMRKDGLIRTPFDLYHTIGADGSITVRSDRNVMLPSPPDAEAATTAIQIFEDYGPVDSSLFLEMHAFVPSNNPNHCAVIPGKNFLRRPIAPGRSDPNSTLLLRALKQLHLTNNPQLTQFVSLEDVCVRNDMSIVEDGTSRVEGRRPASDAIAIMSLLLGESSSTKTLFSNNLETLKSKCITAIESNDVERIELQCARYPGSRRVVKQGLVTAAKRSVSGADVSLETLLSWLKEAEKKEGGGEEGGKEKLALAVRFRIEERKILDSIASRTILDNDDEPNKHISVNTSDDNLAAKISSFNEFIDSLNLPVNKIQAQAVEGMRLGAVATEDLESEQVYISLPSNAVIDAATAVADAETSSPRLAALLKKLDSKGIDGFDVILVYLLHERFVLKDKSKWWPYLDLLPTVQEVSSSHPLFFEEDEMNLYLGGSDVRKLILRNQVRASERHAALASDVDVHEVLGSDVILDKSFVYWATAILDSRSIWWDGRRHLSPLLDLVNADSIGRAHETKVEESSAVTRASRPVKRGEQVCENYQQPNYLLFAFHGFVLDSNPSDCALLGGLSINHNDPGAKFANRLQTSPTFCISGTNVDSMKELAQFLRMKYGLSANNLDSDAWLDEDVVPFLTQVLEERISRLEDLTEAVSGTELEDESIPQKRRYMRHVARSDLTHFLGSLELLKEWKS